MKSRGRYITALILTSLLVIGGYLIFTEPKAGELLSIILVYVVGIFLCMLPVFLFIDPLD